MPTRRGGGPTADALLATDAPINVLFGFFPSPAQLRIPANRA
ncbi:hypothetical protein [Streptomyces longwoodensis]